ncbi:hypothetical protein VCHA30O60_50125 [Vibrio chagasii]|nr:hypothetical protein VCHA30O60_50125 [Vibrio chagasii]
MFSVFFKGLKSVIRGVDSKTLFKWLKLIFWLVKKREDNPMDKDASKAISLIDGNNVSIDVVVDEGELKVQGKLFGAIGDALEYADTPALFSLASEVTDVIQERDDNSMNKDAETIKGLIARNIAKA